MEFIAPAVLLMFLVNKTVDWIRDVLPDTVEGKTLIPLSMTVGALYLLAFSATEWAAIMEVGDTSLAELNWIAVVLAGMGIGAGGSQLNDFKPTKLSPEQIRQAVANADTVVLETGADTPAPLAEPAKTSTTTRKRTTRRQA